jgi:hypothetical protein
MSRPLLTEHTSAHDFASFYWLKEELVAFCRAQGLSTQGSKQELSARIRQFLESGTVQKPTPPATRKATMPGAFTRQSVIAPGWRCSQVLRAFFEREIGTGFHFDEVMREFIHHGAGKTLDEAIATWEAAQAGPQQPKEIAPQFEYNRYLREYFSVHPGATLDEAIQAWNSYKAVRRTSH